MRSQKHDDNTTRIAVLENTVGHIHETLERIEKNIEKGFNDVNNRIDKLDHRVDKLDYRIDEVNNRLWTNFLWLLGVIIGGFVGVTGFIAHALHWV